MIVLCRRGLSTFDFFNSRQSVSLAIDHRVHLQYSNLRINSRMLNTISRLIKNGGQNLDQKSEKRSQNLMEATEVLANIEKHLSILHHRNFQLRQAILAKSERGVEKRRSQFIAVLRSYIRLVVSELHGPVAQTISTDKKAQYEELKRESFSQYDKMIEKSNLSAKKMISAGSDYVRELFYIEIELKKFQKQEEKLVYPLHTQETDDDWDDDDIGLDLLSKN